MSNFAVEPIKATKNSNKRGNSYSGAVGFWQLIRDYSPDSNVVVICGYGCRTSGYLGAKYINTL